MHLVFFSAWLLSIEKQKSSIFLRCGSRNTRMPHSLYHNGQIRIILIEEKETEVLPLEVKREVHEQVGEELLETSLKAALKEVLYVTTTTFCCFLTQKPWPSKARSDHIILPLGCHNTLHGRSMSCSCNWASLSPTSCPPCDTKALWISNLVLLAAPQTFQAHSYLKDFVFTLFPPVCAQQVTTRFLPSNQTPGKLIWLP